jgi:hypothetical protein
LQCEYERFSRATPKHLCDAERQQIQSLAADIPALWHAASTTPEDRQTIARLLLEQVTVTVEGDTDVVEVELRWAGGFVSRHSLTRPVQTYKQLANYDELVARIDSLRAESKTLTEIAATLNAEGFQPPKRSQKFTKGILSNLLRERRAKSGYRTDPELGRHLQTNEWWLADLAAELSMPIATLHRWRRVGWIASRKVPIGAGRWAIYADAKEIDRMRQLRSATRTWPPIYPPELTTPKSPTKSDTTQQQC